MHDNFEKVLKNAEMDCYKKYINIDHASLMESCGVVFDGLMCWPYTRAGETAYQNCTNDYLISQFPGNATKYCSINGTWYSRPNKTQHFTNYSLCGPLNIKFEVEDEKQLDYNNWLPIIKITSYVGWSLSILSLLIAITIFISIKRLHCQRNKLHVHLFASFLFRAIMLVMKDSLFVEGTALKNEVDFVNGIPKFNRTSYSWLCKTIISLRYYFIMCNFMMVLMEGMYLHNLMFLNLFSDNNDVAIYYSLGWGVPLFLIMTWVSIKLSYDDTLCWTRMNRISLFIDIPIGITVVVNFILFMLIVRVLFLKLNMICIQQKKIKYRKLLKSTLILIPLFGIPYIITFILKFWVVYNHLLELIWLLFDQSFAAFQGLIASLVYCFLNSEVKIELRRKYEAIKDRNNKEFRRTRTISHTQQFSLPLNEDNVSENLKNFTVPEDGNKNKQSDCYF